MGCLTGRPGAMSRYPLSRRPLGAVGATRWPAGRCCDSLPPNAGHSDPTRRPGRGSAPNGHPTPPNHTRKAAGSLPVSRQRVAGSPPAAANGCRLGTQAPKHCRGTATVADRPPVRPGWCSSLRPRTSPAVPAQRRRLICRRRTDSDRNLCWCGDHQAWSCNRSPHQHGGHLDSH